MSDATKARLANYARHYLFGLLTQSFNGAITGVMALGIMGEQGKLPEGITVHVLAHTFAVSWFLSALIWLKSHPLPEQIPGTIPPFSALPIP